MDLQQIRSKLDLAGVTYRVWKDVRVYVTSTPNGGRGDYGYLAAGDDGSTGTCQGISKRKGEISAILRG